MPPEYCEYGPDYETHCKPWLKKTHPDIYAKLKAARKGKVEEAEVDEKEAPGPTEPWTTEQRLQAFYGKYMPEKVDGIPAILEKYAGKEQKLFVALVKKYGPEPEDPYYANQNDDDDDDDNSDDDSLNAGMSKMDMKKRRGATAKTVHKVDTRVIIQKISRNRKKAVTIVVGMDTVPDVKLKDVSKAFSKRFAGSSSVKDAAGGKKEIILQGDHQDEAAAFIVDKFKVPGDAVFLDMDGEFVPFA